MTVAAVVAGALLAVCFAWAALAKLRDREATADSFGSLGLRQPATLALVVPLAELATALALVSYPVAGGVAALFLLVAFSAVLVGVIRRGVPLGCACFGAVAKDSVSPVTWRSLARNGALIALATFVVLAGPR